MQLPEIQQTSEAVPVYYNRKQREAIQVNARDMTLLWARGTGKSDGAVAPRLTLCAQLMPRSLGIIVGATYQQILTRELPAIIKGWARLGYVHGVHYFIGDTAPRNWGWELPYFMPQNTKYFIHWFNGSGMAMVSLDRSGSANGISADYLVGIEARFLRHDRYHEEVIPILRGNREHFGSMWCYRSKLLTSDMPIHESGQWLLDKEKDQVPEVVLAIKAWAMRVGTLKKLLLKPSLSPGTVHNYRAELASAEFYLNSLRKRTGFFSLASAWDNVKVLGVGYIEDMQRTLPEPLFRSSILNERVVRLDGGFYADLGERHLYEAPNNSYLDSIGYDIDKATVQDCRQDSDLVPTLPIRFGPDAGDKFNCLVAGQMVSGEINALKDFYVEKGMKLRDLVRITVSYYAHHPTKEAIVYHDHTFRHEDAVRSITFIDEICTEFQRHGWKVKRVSIGHARRGETKYVLWTRVLREDDPSLPKWRMNRYNTEALYISMIKAGTKATPEGFKKDKSSERKAVRQAEATHLSDAADTLLIGCIQDMSRSDRSASPVVYS